MLTIGRLSRLFKKNKTMAQRISLKLSNENDWLMNAIEQERKKQNRPSQNNMIETILVSFFGERGQKNKKTAKRNVKSKD